MTKQSPTGRGQVPQWFLSERRPVVAAPARVELGDGYRLTVPQWLAEGLEWLVPGTIHGVLSANGCVVLRSPDSLRDAAAEYAAALEAEDGRRAVELSIRNLSVTVDEGRRLRIPEPAWRHLGVPENEYLYAARIFDSLELWREEHYRAVVDRLARGGG